MSFAAVFGPMPGTPGMLSTVSPIRARMSTTCSGVTPSVLKMSAAVTAWSVCTSKSSTLLVEQLGEVLVLGDDADVEVRMRLAQSAHDRRDDVVGLDALFAQHRHVHLVQDLEAALDLRVEVVRRLLAAAPCTRQ